MGEFIEEPFFFDNEGSRLFGILHSPCPKRQRAWIQEPKGIAFCNPFAEEKAISHRVVVNFARFLCRQGYYVLRFDYRGCGDSEGDFEQATLTTRLSDVSRAIDLLQQRTGVGFLSLFGLRLGATLASLVAESDSRIRCLILWEPIVRVKSYFDQFVRMQVIAENIREGMVGKTREHLLKDLQEGKCVDILGFMLSPQCFEEFVKVDMPVPVARFRGPTLIVAIGKHKRNRNDLGLLSEAYKRNNVPVQILYVQERSFWVDPNDAIRELAAWQGHDSLFQQTLDWLEATRR